ncbi:MAG: hypothetical protein WAU02_03595 [Candidatus Saccharimonadales bacterium]
MTKTQAETKLAQTVTETWNRMRSSAELQSLIGRRELALAEVEEFDA